MKTVTAKITVSVTVDMPDDAIVDDVLNELDYNFYADDGARVTNTDIISMEIKSNKSA